MKIVAIVEKIGGPSSGDEAIKWKETKIFDSGDAIEKILRWACGNYNFENNENKRMSSNNIVITIPDNKDND